MWRRYGSKYNSVKAEVEGITFDSIREARRYQELLFLKNTGQIKDLQMQVKYTLIPTQREPSAIGSRGGVKPGKVIEKECYYKADFVYTDCDTGETVVEDTKGFKTKEYLIKKKLMLWVHGIRIKEV